MLIISVFCFSKVPPPGRLLRQLPAVKPAGTGYREPEYLLLRGTRGLQHPPLSRGELMICVLWDMVDPGFWRKKRGGGRAVLQINIGALCVGPLFCDAFKLCQQSNLNLI